MKYYSNIATVSVGLLQQYYQYLNLFIIYRKFNKVISSTCDIFTAQYAEKIRPSDHEIQLLE